MTLSRRRLLNRAIAIAGGAGFAGITASGHAETTKMAKTDVDYQDSPKDGHECSGCKFFIAPNSCQYVQGVIAPSGWCKLWLAKTS